jgi:ABC-type Fe3+ transport system substrate-binding protein
MRPWGVRAAVGALALALAGCGTAAPAPPTAPATNPPAKPTAPAAATAAPTQVQASATQASGAQPAATGAQAASDWQAQWDQLLAAARAEGEVAVVGLTDTTGPYVIDKFRQRFGINVKSMGVTSADASPRLVTEQRQSVYQWDVYFSSAGNLLSTVVPAGGIEDVDILNDVLLSPEVKDPKNYRTGGLLFANGDHRLLIDAIDVRGSSIWVNTQTLAQKSLTYNTYKDLFNPALPYKGLVGLRAPSRPHAGTNILAATYYVDGTDAVQAVLNQSTYIDNTRVLTDEFLRGRLAFNIGGDATPIEECQAQGACQEIKRSSVPPYALADITAMIKKAPHPNAAKVFINWIMSKEGQQVWVDAQKEEPRPYTRSHSIRVDVEPDPDALPAADGGMPVYERLNQDYLVIGLNSDSLDTGQKVIDLYKQISGGAAPAQ